MTAVTAKRADVVLNIVLVVREGRAALLAFSIGDHIISIAEEAYAWRIAANAIGKHDRARNTGNIAEIPSNQTLRAIVVGDADLAIGQKLSTGKAVVKNSCVGCEEEAGVAGAAPGGRRAKNAIGNVLPAT